MQKKFTSNNNINKQVKEIAISSAKFLLDDKPTEKKDAISIYNHWSQVNDISINNIEVSDWTLKYIATIKEIDMNLLNEAIRLDTNQTK